MVFKATSRDVTIQKMNIEDRKGKRRRSPRNNGKVREREKDEINWVKCCCSVKEEKKQELITGFTNVKVTGILDKSCCGGAGHGKGQNPQQSGFRRKCWEMSIASSENTFKEFCSKKKQRNETLGRKKESYFFFFKAGKYLGDAG